MDAVETKPVCLPHQAADPAASTCAFCGRADELLVSTPAGEVCEQCQSDLYELENDDE